MELALPSNKLNPWTLIDRAMSGLRAELITHDPAFTAKAAFDSPMRRVMQDKLRKQFTTESLHSETAQALYDIENNSTFAVEKLASIGYQRLRHLRAHGRTFHDISRDMGVNVNDIIEFMRLSPTAIEDAEQDEESCADARTLELEHYVKNEPILNKNDTIRMQLLTNIQLEMNKRLSSKWAKGTSTQKEQEQLEDQAKTATITMIINNASENNPKIVQDYKTADPTAGKDYGSMGQEAEQIEFSIGLPGE